MLVPDQAELSPTVCAAVLQLGHEYYLRLGSCSRHTNQGKLGGDDFRALEHVTAVRSQMVVDSLLRDFD